MAEVTIRLMKNGPYVITGPVQMVDDRGNVYPTEDKKMIALCRCGQSGIRPYCDGTHARCKFESADQVR